MTKKIGIILLLGLLWGTTYSQQTKLYRSTISNDIGMSYVGLGFNIISKRTIDSIGSFELRARPVWQGSYHFALKKWFSLGLAVSTQHLSGTIYDFHYKNNDVLEYLDMNFSIRRTKFGLCPMFHYGNFPKLDMYSGFNIGYMLTKATINAEIPGVRAQDLFSFRIGSRVSMQMLFYGVRYYIGKNFGIHAEIGLGAPFFGSTGIQVRF